MRSIAQSLCKRPSEFLLLGTKDYNQLMLVNPRKSFDADMNLKVSIRKLLIDRTNPTNYDRDRLEAMAARNFNPQDLYKAQCEAFDVEKLTKEFYRGYREIFEYVQQVIKANNPHSYFDDPSCLHQFSQRLLGRIMFLYFLQKKGFLGCDHNFLKNQYPRQSEPEDTDFYTGVLEPLFFETLNKQRLDCNSRWGKIPYLNGGLFEKDYGDGLIDSTGVATAPQIQLPNSLFDPSGEKGILKFFNGYNFTVDENVQGDEEVAVDPEMLGKVFENLLATEERGQSGTFYTPRPIVHFMCVESLSRYLADSSGMTPDAIKQLIELDPDITNADLGQLLTKEQARKLKQALEEVKCLDPAVGSAAFPLGMMQVILAVKQAITHREDGRPVERGSLTISRWKRDIIENNLYGVDIKPEAIEIAKLRMWLSLVVDIPTVDDVDPLPNLDYKLMCGNSLISKIHGEQLIPDLTQDGLQLELNVTPVQAAIQPLLRLQQQYYSAHSEERKALRKQIVETEMNVFRVAIADRRQLWESKRRKLEQDIQRMGRASRTQVKEQQVIAEKLAELDKFAAEVESGKRSLNFFQYHLHFNDVFQKKGGFDILIGNPPYGIVFDTYFKQVYEDEFVSFRRNNDIYIAFYEKGTNLTNEGGYLSYITPNTFLNGDYFESFRKMLTAKMKLIEVRDFKNKNIFDDPTVFVCISNCKKQNNINYPYSYISSIAKDSINALHTEEVICNGATDSPLKQNNILLSRILQQPLVSLIEDLFYVKDVGFNYWTKGKGKKRDGNSIGNRIFYAGSKRNKNDIPFLKGRDVHKYHKKAPQNYLRHDYQKYLDKDIDVFRYSSDFLELKPKIIYRQTSSKIVATIDYESNYLDKTLHLIVTKANNSKSDIRFILALLNSSLFNYLYRHISQEEEGRAFSQVKTTYIKQLPIKLISICAQKPFIEMIDNIFIITKNEAYLENIEAQLQVKEYEQKIDEMIFKLYELTEEEIEIVRREHT